MNKNTPLLVFVAIFLLINASYVLATKTCFENDYNETICYDVDSNIFPQGINLYEGSNDRYGLFIENPDIETTNSAWGKFTSWVRNLFDDNQINVDDLTDETTFEFQSYDDFYNFLQQNNANGNVTLFTSKDVNLEERERTRVLTTQVLNWIQLILYMIIELFKTILNLVMVFGTAILLFKLIPYILNKVKSIVYKVMIKRVSK